jgi:hypothetical protein
MNPAINPNTIQAKIDIIRSPEYLVIVASVVWKAF